MNKKFFKVLFCKYNDNHQICIIVKFCQNNNNITLYILVELYHRFIYIIFILESILFNKS